MEKNTVFQKNLGLRAIFISKEKKCPLPNLPIILVAEQVIGKIKIPNILGKLGTNSNGYVSFKIDANKLQQYAEVYIYPLGYESLKTPMSAFVKDTQGTGIQVIELEYKTISQIKTETIPSVQMADLIDQDYIPYFSHVKIGKSCSTYKDNTTPNDDPNNDPTNSDVVVDDTVEPDCNCHGGNGHDETYCEALIPGILPTECIKIHQLDKHSNQTTNLPGRNIKDRLPHLEIQNGIVHIYESCFEQFGYSLGNLLHSMPLAPCEVVNIAIENWFRKDKVSRSETTSKHEILENETIKSKSVQEFIKSKLTEHKFNVNISAAAKIKKIPVAINVGYAFGSRKSTSEMAQEINETQQQLSSTYSSLNSLIVQEVSQSESRDTTTRTIRNHNHCHSLTIMYYEVIQNIKLTTTLLGHRPCIFIKYPTPCFTLKDVIAKRHIFREVLLDSQLISCLDSLCLDDYNCNCATPTTTESNSGGTNNNNNCPATVTHLKVKVTVADTTFAPSEGNLYLEVESNGSTNSYFIPHAPDSLYKRNKSYETTISIPPTCITAFTKVGLKLVGTDKIILTNLEISYKCVEGGNNYFFFFNQALNNLGLNNGTDIYWIDKAISPQLPPVTPPSEAPAVPNPTEEAQANQSCCENNLLQHLNCNKLYYYKILWMLEDENERAIRFSGYDYNGEYLSDAIENTPLGVVGNWVAFTLSNGRMIPATEHIVDVTTIHAPTGSLFSEAILGNCSSCETINNNVFWDWTGKTCPDNAPTITTGNLSQYQSSTLTPYAFANSLLSLQAFSSLTGTSLLSDIVKQAMGQSLAVVPELNDKIITKLLELLEDTNNNNNSNTTPDPDYEAAVQDLINKLKSLKDINTMIQGFLGK